MKQIIKVSTSWESGLGELWRVITVTLFLVTVIIRYDKRGNQMSVEQTILQESSALDSALSKLKAARKYRSDKRIYGVERVEHYVSDVEGDWLENWSAPDESVQPKSPVSG